MASQQYRQQSSGTLGLLTNCLSCGPSATTYSGRVCATNALTFIDNENGFNGSMNVSLPLYSIGDVVLAKPNASGALVCVEIMGINFPDPPDRYIDIVSGPWNQCTSCIVP
jgi:hypothetical protein